MSEDDTTPRANQVIEPNGTVFYLLTAWNVGVSAGFTSLGGVPQMLDDSPNGFTDDELLQNLPALRKFARRFQKSANDVDDLVQETVAKAIAHSDSFRRGTQLRSWLFTIMRNAFCTKFNVSKREQVGGIDDCAAWASSPPPQDWELRGHELERAINALPQNYRIVVDLVLIQGISYETAAERCDVPIGTIKSRVNRARLRLAALLDGDPSV